MGKTTRSKQLARQLQDQGKRVVLLHEGTGNQLEPGGKAFLNGIGVDAALLDKTDDLLMKAWSAYWHTAGQASGFFVCDGIFLQSLVIEIGLYRGEVRRCCGLMERLWTTLDLRKPVLIYLEAKDYELIYERLLEERGQKWLDGLQMWLDRAEFARHRSLRGKEGILTYMAYRNQMEKEILDLCGIPVLYRYD